MQNMYKTKRPFNHGPQVQTVHTQADKDIMYNHNTGQEVGCLRL